MKSLLFISLFVLLSTSFSFPDIRYVSKTGSSTPPYLTWETASDSIQKAINICNEGDTIYVGNGVYKENLLLNKFITLIGNSMDSTVIDGRNMSIKTVLFNVGGCIQNFRIYGRGFNMQGSAVIIGYGTFEIRYCKVSDALSGISITDGNGAIRNNFIGGTGTACGGGNNNYQYTEYFENNIISVSKWGTGIDIGDGIALIKNNIILPNNSDFGIYLWWPKHAYIYNNLVSGFEYNIWLAHDDDTIYVINNAIVNKLNTGGFTDPALYIGRKGVIKNNIFAYNKNTAAYAENNIPCDYNLFWENSNDVYGFEKGPHDITADPMFVKDTIPVINGNYDFHLQKYSPCIDKGDPLIRDSDSSVSDIGLYGGPFSESYTYNNFAPRAPENLTAVIDSQFIQIKWNKNTEADTAYYNVYRDTAADFTISPLNLKSRQRLNEFVDINPKKNIKYYYKLTAEDTEGNISTPSKELAVTISDITREPQFISDYALYQNYPNPFNPTTKIGYTLKESGYVKLQVYDVKGEVVKILVNERQEAGYYEKEFRGEGLASGIYIYRIEVIGKGNIPVFIEMRKTILIK